MAQWIRICLPMQGTQVWSLLREDSTRCGVTKPANWNYWTPVCLEPVLCKQTPRRETCALQLSRPRSLQLEKACVPQRRPSATLPAPPPKEENKFLKIKIWKQCGGSNSIKHRLAYAGHGCSAHKILSSVWNKTFFNGTISLIITIVLLISLLEQKQKLLWITQIICHLLFVHACVLQSCPTLRDPMDHWSPGPSVHGIFKARILEWLAMCSSRGSSWLRAGSWVSFTSFIGSRVLYH